MIHFREMTEEEFEEYKVYSIEDYAYDLVRSGNETKETALASSVEEFYEILPQGLETRHQHIYVIVADQDKEVGVIWYGPHYKQKEMAFIFDILVRSDARNKGYGTAALHRIEQDAAEHGYTRIGLNVFNFNKKALALYEKCGYTPLERFDGNMHMHKKIEYVAK